MSTTDRNAGALENCPSCGEASASKVERDHVFPYATAEGDVSIKARIDVLRCESCGDEFIDGEGERKQHEAICEYLGRMKPSQIRELRRNFNLNQEEFASATGIGVASIKRWESGNLIQNEAMDRYLRLVQRSDLLAALDPRFHGDPVFRTALSDSQRARAESFELRPKREVSVPELTYELS